MPHIVIKLYTCLLGDKIFPKKNDVWTMMIKSLRKTYWEKDKCIKALFKF